MASEGWPEGFLWGTGASATQCQGAAPASDWFGWQRDGHAPISGAGNDFASRHREDFAPLAAAGLRHHRLSLEWARLEPEPGASRLAEIVDASLWGSWLGILKHGVLRVPGREPVSCPELAAAFDLVGFSYYSALGVAAGGGLAPYPAEGPVSPLGYAIWPEGLAGVLGRLHAELPGQPLLISELGLGTHDDAERCRYLRACLALARDSIVHGANLRGIFHWTATDNYEWLHGYGVPFGCITRDRQPRASYHLLAEEAGGQA